MVARGQHRADRPGHPDLVRRERPPLRARAGRTACRTTARTSRTGRRWARWPAGRRSWPTASARSRRSPARRTAAAPPGGSCRTTRRRPARVAGSDGEVHGVSQPEARIISHRMRRDTLLDFFDDLAALRGTFLAYDNGFRRWSFSLRRGQPRRPRLWRAAGRGRARARATPSSSGPRTGPSGLRRCGAAGSRASSPCPSTTAPRRTSSTASPASSRRAWCWRATRWTAAQAGPTPVWPLAEFDWHATAEAPRADGHPRRHGGDHLHVGRHGRAQGRGHHAPQHPGQHRPGRARDPEVPEVRAAVFADPVPEPAAAEPHVRPVDGDVHPAAAVGHGRLHARLQPARHRPADRVAPRVGAGVGAEDPGRAARARAARGAGIGRAAAGQGAFHQALVALSPGAPAVRTEVLELRRRRRAARSVARGVLGPAGLRRDPGLRPHRDRAHRAASTTRSAPARDRSARRLPASR